MALSASARRQVWSERLRRFSQSGRTVAAFCQRERVAVSSFYEWRKKLGFTTDETIETRSRNRQPTFVPVQITGHPLDTAAVEIRLPNGVQVWLPTDASLLAAGIAAAGRLNRAGQEEGQAC